MSEEERRRRRNEASRRCYLKRKAELAAQAQPVGAKNHKSKAETKPARRGPDPVVAAERLCRTYAKVANGVKPMVKDVVRFLSDVYKTEDRGVVLKVERILTKGLGVWIGHMPDDSGEKTRVRLDVLSSAVKTPEFRLTPAEPEPEVEPEPPPETEDKQETEPEAEPEPAEVPVDPTLLEKVDTGEVDKSEIEIPQSKDDESDDEDDEDELDPEDDELDDEDDEDDEDDDEDDESEEAQERRARRRRREESDSVREYETGRWEMMGEMGAQGAFDD